MVDYDQIEVELDEGADGEDEEGDSQRMVHHGHGRDDQDDDEEDGENEVSINLEDAIATAEEINKQNSLEKLQHYDNSQKHLRQDADGSDMDGEEVDDEDDVEGQRFVEVNGELVSAEEIAGIVTDGHNEKDGFDQMREEQLHRQRMVR